MWIPMVSATETASSRSWRDEQYSSLSSFPHFFINRPIPSYPCCLSNNAVTEESTPPDMPTTTRLVIMSQQLQRIAFAGEVIFHAAQDQRAALARLRGAYLIGCQPYGLQYAGVELTASLMAGDRAGESKAQISGV